MSSIDAQIQKAAQWIKEADYVLIAAAAGLSAEAGHDYTDEVAFKERFPAMAKRGFKYPYQFIGKHDWTKNLQWGYLSAFINMFRFNFPPNEVYQTLKELVKTKNYFVITSNVDGFFVNNGFDESKVFTPQGDFKYFQCAKPCVDKVWEAKPIIDKIVPHINETQEIPDEFIPKCLYCGGHVACNVRGGNYFLESPYKQQEQAYHEWLENALQQPDKKLAIIEIGAGFNTPSVIRWRMEKIIVAAHHQSKLIRINRDHEQVPPQFIEADVGLGLPLNALPALTQLKQLSE